MAGWFGGPESNLFLFPFAAMFGGLAQFLAGMWAYRARDGLATAMHGMWGAFWLAYGLLNVFALIGRLTPPAPLFDELGYWFIVLAAITWMGAVAAAAEGVAITGVLGFLAAGSTLAAIANLAGLGKVNMIAGWLLIISAIIAWYTASALMLESVYGRAVLPVGATERVQHAPEVTAALGEPGVVRGQAAPQHRRAS